MLYEWYQQAPGKWLLEFEQEQVRKWLPLVQGATVLQMGGLPHLFDFSKTNKQNYFFLSPSLQQDLNQVDVVADYTELPFALNSLNLVLLVHALEFVEQPELLLQEVYDALTPNGKLIIFCFNSWSLWGARRFFSKKDKFPWNGRFLSPTQLQHWLTVIGYNTMKDKTLCFRRPGVRADITRFTLFYEVLGQIAFPVLGAVHVFLVEKRVYGSIAEWEMPWKKNRIINQHRVVEPTTRVKG